jgi:rhodanese-related sulfurtransferase
MNVSPAEALDLINNNPNLLIIDVSPLWHEGHLPGALSFPWGDGSFEAAVPTWDKNTMYLIYCHGDAPAIAAAQHLIYEGFDDVYRLEGNYGAWVDAGYDIELPSYMDISAMELYQMIMDNTELIVIDVSPIFEQGHIPGAVNYYVGDGSLDNAIPDLDPEGDYAVYCHVDSASILGANKLIEAGIYNVYRLEGNFQAWIDAGYPIETDP